MDYKQTKRNKLERGNVDEHFYYFDFSKKNTLNLFKKLVSVI